MNAEQQERIEALEKENEKLRQSIDSMKAIMREGMAPYVTFEVFDQILAGKDGMVIESERRDVTMMFCDLRKSTELSEQMDAIDYIRMLNHYLEDMILIIDAWEGNITGFVGDAIVAVYGAPKPNPQSAFQAVGSAVAMQRRMRAVNDWNDAQGYPNLQMGVGIHSGEAILGCIGSQTRMKYDMIGRNVNLAARIEGYSEGGQILVSDETLKAAGDRVVVRPEGSRWVHPKGIHDEVLIHEVIGFGSNRIA